MILPNYLRNSTPWLSEFNRLFETTLRPQQGTPSALRLFEAEDGWLLEVDYPGVEKDDLSITIENGLMVIEDTREGSSRPTYELPVSDEIDPTSISAALKNGVLTLNLRRTPSTRKTIEIL